MRPRVLLVVVAAVACGGDASRAPARPSIGNVPGPEPVASAPGSCVDPIAGTWRARVYRAEVGKLDEVTLTLARVGMTELRGQILVETWDAAGRDEEPPACPDGAPAVGRVVQMASGWFRDRELDVVGRDPKRVAAPCDVPTEAGYNPDHFTGELDEDGRTLVTTNDDGGLDVGRPHVFTRIACQGT